MRSNRYLHIAVIVATLLFLVLWQTGQGNAAINIALNKPASTNKNIWVLYPPSNAVDGDIETYWNAGHHANPVDPTWLKIDLEGAFAIGQIVLKVRNFVAVHSQKLV